MRLMVGLAFFSVLILITPSFAQAPNLTSPLPSSQQEGSKPTIPDAKTLAANYELANGAGDRKCKIALDVRPTGPGFSLVYDRAECTQLFGFLSETVAWVPGIGGSIRFVNNARRTVSEFTEGVNGQYEALREGDGVYFLSNLQFVDPSDTPQFADVVGDWNLARPGSPPMCSLTLSDQPAGEGTFTLTLKPGCDQAIARLGPVSWFLDRGDIILMSAKGERLRFGRQLEGGWAKVPDTPRPLLMARP
jgi:hypothetical protein